MERRNPRHSLFAVFLLCGLLAFAVPVIIPVGPRAFYLTVVSAGFVLAALWFQKKPRLSSYFPVCLAFGVASLVHLLQTLPFALGATVTTRNEILAWQLVRTLLTVATILFFTRISGANMGSLYLRRGKLGLGLIIGVAAFTFFFLTAPQGAGLVTGQTVSLGTTFSLVPWLMPFVLSNGLREELWFRGLFLQKYDVFLGPRISNVLQAIIFSLSHLGEVYTPTLLSFLLQTFILGLIWGFLVQRTGSLLASSIFHAGADVPIVVVLLSNS